MKRMIKASSEKKTFRIYFNDGNQKLVEAAEIYSALYYIVFELGFSAYSVYKIEEV